MWLLAVAPRRTPRDGPTDALAIFWNTKKQTNAAPAIQGAYAVNQSNSPDDSAPKPCCCSFVRPAGDPILAPRIGDSLSSLVEEGPRFCNLDGPRQSI